MKPLSQFKFIGSFVGLFVLFLIVAFISTANADATGTRAKTISTTPTDITIATIGAQPKQEYVSSIYQADFPFNGVGLNWIGTAQDVQFWLKVDEHEWNLMEMVDSESKDQAEHNVSLPLFIDGSSVQYKITGQDTEQVQNIRLTYFDSTIPPSTSSLRSLASSMKRSIKATTASALTVIHRADWGADESWRHWDPQYTTPTKFIVHHTAGGNGGSDPAATIRGIYYWQSTVLGWGDIGYNYIIDPTGNIYEGRYGGEIGNTSVIGAHAYNSISQTNFNVGSIGIVLLGCYEDTAGSCGTLNEVTPEMEKSLTNLIANKAAQFNINPTGESDWHTIRTANIIGHRDVDATACPGNTIEDILPRIRELSGTEYSTLSVRGVNYQATWSTTDLATSYSNTDTPTVNFSYTNNGTQAWLNNQVHLQISVKDKRLRQRVELPNVVNAGEVVTIPVLWSTLPQESGNFTIITKLYRNKKVISGSRHKVDVTITNPYQATITSANMPIAIRQGWTPKIDLTVENTGTSSWDKYTVMKVNGVVVGQLKNGLKTGEKHTFSFTLPVDLSSSANTTQPLLLQLSNPNYRIGGGRLATTIRIDK